MGGSCTGDGGNFYSDCALFVVCDGKFASASHGSSCLTHLVVLLGDMGGPCTVMVGAAVSSGAEEEEGVEA